MLKLNQKGIVYLSLLPFAILGIITFLLISFNAPLKEKLLSSLYQKDNAYASVAIPADLNSDGSVNVTDLSIMLSKWNSAEAIADLDSDGRVSVLDLSTLLTGWGQQSSPTPVAMIEGVAVCTDHDNTKWHSLVKKNADGSVNCTYTHDHKNDPRVLDDIFGPVGQYTNGQEISYPWQTSSALGPENVVKHRVYDWEVVRVNTCKPSFAQFGFDAIRRETHADGIAGATVRFHSYYFEARTCDPNDPSYHGIVKMGGHLDTNALFVGNDFTHVPLAGDPTTVVTGGPGRFHMIANPDGSLPPQNRNGDFTWYHRTCSVTVPGLTCFGMSGGVRKEDWGGVDPNNPSGNLIARPQDLNGSYIEPVHLIALNVQGYHDSIDGKQDGVINFTGFTDRYGNIVQSCSPVGPDCIPIVLQNIKMGSYQFRADNNGILTTEYDVKAPNGKTLITFPN